MARQSGFYRAQVVDNKDKDDYGKVMVYIPDLMPELDSTKDGLWASPANNPMGGLNKEGNAKHHFMGSSYIPAIGSWVWVFFENGRDERPYYFGALDIENSKVLPENRVGTDKYAKWVIFKSNKGRTIVVSDDVDDCRVEITGKKRLLKDLPSGDTTSVYTIPNNQTTILLDEREGKEKLLIQTYLGDFIKIDITNSKLQAQFKSDISIESVTGSISLNAGKDINITAMQNINTTATKNINTNAMQNINTIATQNISTIASGSINSTSTKDINNTSSENINSMALKNYNICSVQENVNVASTSKNINVLAGQYVNLDSPYAINEQAGKADPNSPVASPAIITPDIIIPDPPIGGR